MKNGCLALAAMLALAAIAGCFRPADPEPVPEWTTLFHWEGRNACTTVIGRVPLEEFDVRQTEVLVNVSMNLTAHVVQVRLVDGENKNVYDRTFTSTGTDSVAMGRAAPGSWQFSVNCHAFSPAEFNWVLDAKGRNTPA